MLEKDVISISGIFSSFDDWVTFWDETSTAFLCIESGAGEIVFFSVHPLNRTDSNRNIMAVVTILFLDNISFLPVYLLFRTILCDARSIVIRRNASNPGIFSILSEAGEVPDGMVTSGLSGEEFSTIASGITCAPPIFVG